jgi:hypothetical protein
MQGGNKHANVILFGKPLGRSRHPQEHNVETDFREIDREGVD